MANDDERLVTLLEARITDFEKNLRKANATAGKEFGGVRRHSRSATRQMEADMARSTARIQQHLAGFSSKIGSYGKAFVGGLVAGGVTGAVAGFGQIANSMAVISDEAKRAGLSMQSFQELKYVAEQNRLGIDSLVDGMKELNLRADEFIVTKAGPAAEAFGRLGYTAEDLKKKLEDPSKLFTEIIGKLGKLDKAAQIRIADEIFGGTGGEKFVQLIEQGEKGIRSSIEEAHRLGAVIEDDVIVAAIELDRKFNLVANTVGNALRSAIVSAADSLQDFIDRFNSFEKRRDATLKADSTALGRERLDVEGQIGKFRGMKPSEGAGDGATWFNIGESTAAEKLQELENRLYEINTQEAAINGILAERQKLRDQDNAKAGGSSNWTPPTTPPPGRGGRGGGVKRETDEVRELIAELEREIALVNQSDQAKRAAEAIRKAGADATEKEKAKVVELTEALYQEKAAHQARADAAAKAMEDMLERQEQIAQVGEWGFGLMEDAISGVIDKTMTAEEALKKMLVQLALAAAQGAILGTGPLGGLLGSLMGGGASIPAGIPGPWGAGFASGTANTGGNRGQPRGVVHGQEAVIPLPNGGRVPVDLGNAGQTVNVGGFNPVVHIGSVGQGVSKDEVADTVRRALKQQEKEFFAKLPDMMLKHKSRGAFS